MRKGQVWSTDLVAGVIIFMLVIGIFYVFLNRQASNDTDKLQFESELASSKLVGDDAISIAQNNEIQPKDLQSLVSNVTKDYEGTKEKLGIKGEYCIVIQDQNGNLLELEDSEGKKFVGIGNNDLNLTSTGIYCGEKG